MKRWCGSRGEGRTWGTPLALAVVLAVLASGCGDGDTRAVGKTYAVKGKVLLPDGKPLPAVKVVFSGPAMNNAVTEGDGTFALKEGAGLPAGDYQVRLEVNESKGTLKNQQLPFPRHYLDEDGSGLTAKVTADGPNDFEFKLTKDEPAAAKDSGRSGRR